MSRRLAGLAPIALIAIVMLAGCGSTSSVAPRTDAVAAPQGSPSSTTSNHDLAVRDVATHIASFRAPAGAHQLSGRPSNVPQLNVPPLGSPKPIDVTRTTWWQMAGKPTEVLPAIATPAGASGSGIGSSGGAVWVYDLEFDWPVQTGVLAMRVLEVTARAVGSQTVFRVDAITTWVPPRDPATFIPASASAVTIAYGTAAISPRKQDTFGPVTVSDPATVAAISAALNADQVETQGVHPCPASLTRMSLTFHGSTPGATVATIDIDTGGCNDGYLQITGGKSAILAGGHALVAKIMSLAKLPWPRPS